MITLDVPVTPYVLKFMNVLYGEKYILSLHDSLGKVIHGMLQQKINSRADLASTSRHSFRIVIPISTTKNYGCVIHKSNMHQLSLYCDKYFRDMIFSYTLIRSKNMPQDKQNIKEGLREALAVFNISEDDIALDTLYRDYIRKRTDSPFLGISETRKTG